MHNQRTYLGIIFEVWEGQQSWFWFVIDPHCDGGAIGVSASETEAVGEACVSIDGMLAHLEPLPMTPQCWEASLASLERYLTCVRDATA
jgi:hypothetical protein